MQYDKFMFIIKILKASLKPAFVFSSSFIWWYLMWFTFHTFTCN